MQSRHFRVNRRLDRRVAGFERRKVVNRGLNLGRFGCNRRGDGGYRVKNRLVRRYAFSTTRGGQL